MKSGDHADRGRVTRGCVADVNVAALRLLSELRTTAPYLDERFVASYMLGMGKVSPDAAKHLLALPGSSSGAAR
ncbi:MAG: hypothetical protein ACRDUW_25885 [Pseudonocardiaceae bacterium]